ncbi:cytidine deaminase-like fold-containing protein [Labrys neptuniae]|uniref:Putative cytidine deaminase C-terminal domain-containing protein n=1 Tax=Labrys neptuniae TaxID=376174 RepID=A0ABV3PXY6_9HYPH
MARWTPAAGEADLWPSLDGGQPSPIPRPPQTAAAPYDQAAYDSLYTSSRDPTYAYTIARTMQEVRRAGQAKPGSEDQGEHQPAWETRWFIPEGDPSIAGIGMPRPEQQGASPLGTFGIFPTPAQPPNLNSPTSDEDDEHGPDPLVEPLPASSPDEPFDPGDYYAARKAGLSRQQALDTAISNYRNKGSGFDTYKGGASPPTVPPRPPQDPSDPYDEKKYDSELILTGSPRAALKAAKNAHRSAPQNKGPDGLPVPTVSNKSPKSPSYPPPVLGPGEHIDMADYSYHRDAKMNAADALEAAKADLQKRIKDASQGGAAPTAADYPPNGKAPKLANDETSWVRFLRAAIIQGYADWTVRERQQQIETGVQQRQPDVTVAGVTDGAPVFSMSQKARFDYNDPHQDSLAADAVRLDKERRDKFHKKPMPNEALKNSHGEIVVIHKLHEVGQTEGKFLYLVVNGRDVCGWCAHDIPRAARAAKLKGVIIYESATGYTKYWHPGLNKIKRIGDGSQ